MVWHSAMEPFANRPSGRLSSTHPRCSQTAIIAVMPIVVGIGVPSKYAAFPDASFGTVAAVTLKRARRDKPQRTKKERSKLSTGVRSPNENAATAGEIPKEI